VIAERREQLLLAALVHDARVVKLDIRTNARGRQVGGTLLLLLGGYFAFSAYLIDLTVSQIVFAACALFLGVVLVAERHVLVIDREAGTVVRRRGVILTFPRASMRIADVTHLSLVEFTRVKKNDDDERTRYRVLANGSTQHLLAELSDPWHGRKIAERASAALQVPLDNHVYKTKSRRQPDQLDTPLVERWRMAGKVHARPALPADSTIRVEEHGDEVRVSVPVHTSGRWIIYVLLAFFAVMAVIFYFVMDGPGARIFFYAFFGGSIAFLFMGLLAYSGRSQIAFRGEKVSTRQGRSPFGGTLSVREIEEMIAARTELVLVADRSALSLSWPRSRADREFLKDYVAYELARRSSTPALSTTTS
jgi:hypothetical protein